jgi:hypothetical protein
MALARYERDEQTRLDCDCVEEFYRGDLDSTLECVVRDYVVVFACVLRIGFFTLSLRPSPYDCRRRTRAKLCSIH